MATEKKFNINQFRPVFSAQEGCLRTGKGIGSLACPFYFLPQEVTTMKPKTRIKGVIYVKPSSGKTLASLQWYGKLA